MGQDPNLEQISSNQSFGGQQLRYRHRSTVLDCEMTFSIYLPPQAKQSNVPVLYWLSGLTCTTKTLLPKQEHSGMLRSMELLLSVLTLAPEERVCPMILRAPMILVLVQDSILMQLNSLGRNTTECMIILLTNSHLLLILNCQLTPAKYLFLDILWEGMVR